MVGECLEFADSFFSLSRSFLGVIKFYRVIYMHRFRPSFDEYHTIRRLDLSQHTSWATRKLIGRPSYMNNGSANSSQLGNTLSVSI